MKSKAIVTVIGKDSVGIIARVADLLSGEGVNIEDISQTVLQDYSVMIMMADITGARSDIASLAAKLDELGKKIGVSARIQHEDIFNSMHRI